MADPPRRPVPPPLPPEEPFRHADTPPGGTLVGLPRQLGEVRDDPGPGPAELARLIRGLRSDLVVLRDSLPPLAPSALPTPVPPSRRQAASQVVGNAAKYATLTIGVLGIAAQVAAVFKPGLVGPLQTLIQLLGGTP